MEANPFARYHSARRPVSSTEGALIKARKRTHQDLTSEQKPRKGSFPAKFNPDSCVHTLLLGTQPSDNSLKEGQYFATNENAFWHIVGDALGFRRGFFVGGRTSAPDSIRPHLMHDEAVPYSEALRRLTERGYALWDIVASSERKGSLDSAIRDPSFADIRSLVEQDGAFRGLRRMVFSTGSGSAATFAKANRAWLASGVLSVANDDDSRAVFDKYVRQTNREARIELCVPASVSPACVPRQSWSREKQQAKGFTDLWAERPVHAYCWKRADWFAKVFVGEPAVRDAPRLGDLNTHFQHLGPRLRDSASVAPSPTGAFSRPCGKRKSASDDPAESPDSTSAS
jgi:G:T/U-mismatch repair DNA glycosylase